MKKLILLGGLWLTCAATAFSHDGNNYWERLNRTHPAATLEAIMSSKPASATEVANYRISVVYNGQYRKVSADNLLLMQSAGMKNRDLKSYKYELLFIHEGKELWLPVQTTMVEQLQIEVRKDEQVTLYTTVLQNPAQEDYRQITVLVDDFKLEAE